MSADFDILVTVVVRADNADEACHLLQGELDALPDWYGGHRGMEVDSLVGVPLPPNQEDGE